MKRSQPEVLCKKAVLRKTKKITEEITCAEVSLPMYLHILGQQLYKKKAVVQMFFL